MSPSATGPLRARLSRRARDGSVAVIMALILVGIAGFAALVVDLGYTRLVRSELQIAADAAAHAATMELDGTAAGLTNARAAAVAVGGLHKAAGDAISLDSNDDNAEDGDVVVGIWDGETFTSSTSAADVNAVVVRSAVANLRPFFAQYAFGRETLATQARSTVLRPNGGASAVECFIPLAIPDCLIDDLYGTDGIVEVDLLLNNAGVDSTGWARPDATPSTSWLRAQLEDCGTAGTLAVGETIGLKNGESTSALDTLAEMVEESDSRWDTSTWGTIPAREDDSGVGAGFYGRVFEGPIVTFDDDDYCEDEGGSFTGRVEVSGFVWSAIYDVVTRGPVADRTLKMRIDTKHEYDYGVEQGGPNYGVIIDGVAAIVE